ncbi:MAG: hypothetical protein ACKOEO_03290 [Planctomycetaceae bacterium]
MSLKNHKGITALIAAHPDQQIFGRTRLQKVVKLLRRLGFPSDYAFSIHFDGPYSNSLQWDVGLMQAFGLIEESAETGRDGKDYYVLKSREHGDSHDQAIVRLRRKECKKCEGGHEDTALALLSNLGLETH